MAELDYEYTNEELINSDLICNICHDLLNNPYNCRHCKKHYCLQCITTWLKERNTCPLCRHSCNKSTDLFKDETISAALNFLLVKCKKCGQSDIHRDQINDHIKNHCPGIILYCSNTNRENSSDRHNDIDSNLPIMNKLESLINPLIKQIKYVKEEQQSQKTMLSKHSDQIDILEDYDQSEKNQTNINNIESINKKLIEQQNQIETIKQSNIEHENIIKQLEHVIKIQRKQIEVQEISINELKKDNEYLRNRIKYCHDESTENESQICNLWEKINQLDPHQNPKLENYITKNCQFSSSLILSEENITDRDMEIIVKRAIINRQCSSLDLQKNQITSQGILILSDAFHRNIRLETLDLSYNKLSDKSIEILVEGLLGNITLRKLNLGSTGITNQGVNYLNEMLQFNKTLEKLYLYKNEIDDNGMKLLTNVLSEHNQILDELSIHSNKFITDKSVYFIIEMFRQNQSLQRFEIYQCSFSNQAKIRLRDAAENVSISINV